jgi:hypothetical protein
MSKLNVSFVYQPRSGSRVFVCNPSDAIAVIDWGNGCRHVVGGVELVWPCATKNYWRTEATEVLKSVISQAGGIAWDEQGIVHAVVPHYIAAWIVEYMQIVLNVATGRRSGMASENEIAMFLAGVLPSICTPDTWGTSQDEEISAWMSDPANLPNYAGETGKVSGGRFADEARTRVCAPKEE